MRNKDDFTRLIAASDQLAEAVKITAPILWEYFHSLVGKGFTREEALALTLQLENRLFNGMTNEE